MTEKTDKNFKKLELAQFSPPCERAAKMAERLLLKLQACRILLVLWLAMRTMQDARPTDTL